MPATSLRPVDVQTGRARSHVLTEHFSRTIQILFCLGALWGATHQLCAQAVRVPRGARALEVPASAGLSNYRIGSWQMWNGLPGATVLALSETSDGYLWIGTSNGLARFDGLRFRSYTNQDIPGIEDNDIIGLLASRDGSLWIGTDGESLIQLKGGVARRYRAANSPQSAFIKGLYQDTNGLIWVATDGGLFRVQGDHLESASSELGIAFLNVNRIIQDHLGRYWIGGPQLFVSDHGKAREYVLHRGDPRAHVRSLLETYDGTIWAGTVEGLFRLARGQKQFKRVSGIHATVRSLQEMENGDLLAASIGEGIYRVHNSEVTRLAASKSLLSNTVLSMLKDSDGDLWIGTEAGLERLSKSPVRIVYMPDNESQDYATVSLDVNGGLWAAYKQLFHVQGNDLTPWHFPGMNGVHVRNVFRGRDGSLWIGTDGNGLYHETPSGFVHYDIGNGLVNNYMRSITEAKDGSFWIGTDYGVSHLVPHGFRTFMIENVLVYRSIRCIIEDRDGDVWIGTDRGLSHRRRKSFIDDAVTRALSGERVWSLYQDSDGVLWIGTRGNGLYSYAGGHLAHYTTQTGLVSDSIYCILEDAKGRIWLSTPTAVMMLNRSELIHQADAPSKLVSMHIFSANAGEMATQFYGGRQSTGVITSAGEGCFATISGIWIIDPDADVPSHLAHLNIDWVSIDGRHAPESNSIVLSADSKRVEIAYDLALLSPRSELRFRYKLDGFDRDWIQADPAQRVASYTNLPPGHYRFEAVAWETASPEHEIQAGLNIVKDEFFYHTLRFRSVCFLAMLGLLMLVYWVHVAQLTSKFNAVIKERGRIAREIHDTLIQGCASVSALLHAASSDDAGDLESRSHLVQYASTQIQVTMDEARQAVAGLRTDAQTPQALVCTLRLMTERTWRAYGIETTLVVSGEPFDINQQTSHAIAMVVREAIFNAVLHANAQNIRVHVDFSARDLAIGISDDGQGFTATDSNPEGHYGILGMQERIADFDGELAIDSAPGQGTSVRILLPGARTQAPSPRPETKSGDSGNGLLRLLSGRGSKV
jgi:ligand-binding sensor domain-containing protein